ncbi:MAG: hypothetical protein K6G79_02280 [Bacteroidales bacterium]|nr:hypothetical protein [Bacteroidales bacterium]
MKRIEDIENMEPDELESASLENDIPIPSGLEDRIKAALAAKSALEHRQERSSFRWAPYTALAVAASLAAVALLPGIHRDNLKDTYDDPYLAYAQVEATFQKISEKMAAGVNLADKAGETAEKTIEIIKKISEK